MSDFEYIKQAEDVFIEAIGINKSTDGWKVEKEDTDNNVIVETKTNSKGRKFYCCKVSFQYQKWHYNGKCLSVHPLSNHLNLSESCLTAIINCIGTHTR